MADGVTYRSLHPVQFLDDQTEGRVDSMSHAERQVFEPRPFWKWWWQGGPVDNCCCCVPLRTGVMLLSLGLLVGSITNLFTGRILAYNISRMETTIKETCTEEEPKGMCKIALESKAENEFVLSCTPFLNIVGVVLICFSLIGMRAAFTGNPKLSKLFMKLFPLEIVIQVAMMVFRMAMAPSTITAMVEINFCLGVLTIIYYWKVTWSFYYRRKVMEDMQLAKDASSSQDHRISLPLTQAPAHV